MRTSRLIALLAFSLAGAAAYGCVAPDPATEEGGGGAANQNTLLSNVDNLTNDQPPTLTIDQIAELEAPETCGDGVLDDTEACDDGGKESGDGCLANCLGVEPGWICQDAGESCRRISLCGDGNLTFPEKCDDGNEASGDGCSSSCKVELGFKCEDDGTGLTPCTETVCGDGKVEGAETCDDGNDLPLDGCSATCIAEPNCSAGACTSVCGDGIVLGEECDDGNTIDKDGCSANCTIESDLGYTCSVDTDCERDDQGRCIMRIPTVYRDFAEGGDFQTESCNTNSLATGKVKPLLKNGKPEPTSDVACWHVDDWYTSSSANTTVRGEIVLYDDDEDGTFVNRYGADGEPWVVYPNGSGERIEWCSENAADGCTGQGNCADNGWVECLAPCTPWNNNQACARYAAIPSGGQNMDGNPLFFPVDGITGARDGGGSSARVGPPYADSGWPSEVSLTGSDLKHNFHFTSEVIYWFRFDAGKSATLEFLGDDDVWVFINGHLVIDLGGVHIPLSDSVTIDSTATGKFGGLVDGQVYEIKVFHAERRREGSSFKLTLDGFSTGRSECTSVCGDGIVAIGEQCDDGVNDGGYNECQPNCVLGKFCGDGTVDPGEQCDDAAPDAPVGCSNCRLLTVK